MNILPTKNTARDLHIGPVQFLGRQALYDKTENVDQTSKRTSNKTKNESVK
jgi:hypothetical protein